MRPLAVIGNVNVDLILGPVAPWPAPGTEILANHGEVRVGGAAGNCALTWAAHNVPFDIAANVGNDEFGRWLRDAFKDKAAQWPQTPEATTLSVGITHPGGERTFLSTRGHVAHFSLADALSCLDGQRLAGGTALLCGSFLTDALTASYDDLFDWADTHGIALALDTGWPPAGWTADIRCAVRTWLARCRLALLNEAEAAALTGEQDPVAAARMTCAWMPQGAVAVVKQGPGGATAVDSSGAVAAVTAPDVTVIDTIGAGDIFNAAFLMAEAAGKDLRRCLESGVSVASQAISTQPRDYRPAAAITEAAS